MSLFSRKPDRVPEAAEALAGRDHPSFDIPAEHDVLAGKPLVPPFPDGIDWLLVGMGCFWGAERVFWQTPGVWTTSVGYAGGHDPEPDLPRGLQRPHRPRRGRAGRLRPVRDLDHRGAAASSGRATTRPRACGRATTSAPSTAPRSTGGRRSSVTPPIATRDAYAEALAERGMGADHHRDRRGRRLLPRRGLPPAVPGTRTRTATAGSAEPACPVPSGRAPPPPDLQCYAGGDSANSIYSIL